MSNERGSALVEGVLLALVLMIPVLWLLTVLADVHRGALAVTAAVQEAGSSAARATDRREADAVVGGVVAQAFEDHGLDPRRARVRWGGAIVPSGRLEVVVSYPVEIVRAPFLGPVAGPQIWLRARYAAMVDAYRSDG